MIAFFSKCFFGARTMLNMTLGYSMSSRLAHKTFERREPSSGKKVSGFVTTVTHMTGGEGQTSRFLLCTITVRTYVYINYFFTIY